MVEAALETAGFDARFVDEGEDVGGELGIAFARISDLVKFGREAVETGGCEICAVGSYRGDKGRTHR